MTLLIVIRLQQQFLTNWLILAVVGVGGDGDAAGAEAGDGNNTTTTHTLADGTPVSTSFMVLISLCRINVPVVIQTTLYSYQV